MYAIRRKDNPLKILAFAYSDGPGKVRETFDSSVYEEVELESLPEGWEEEPLPPEGKPAQLESMLDAAAASLLAGDVELPAGTLTQIANLSATLKELARLAPESVYVPEAINAINALPPLPQAFEAVKDQMLAVLNG